MRIFIFTASFLFFIISHALIYEKKSGEQVFYSDQASSDSHLISLPKQPQIEVLPRVAQELLSANSLNPPPAAVSVDNSQTKILIDGKDNQDIHNLERGEHTKQVVEVNGGLEQKAKSQEETFYVHKASVLFPEEEK